MNRENGSMTIAVLGIDIGKNSCSMVSLDERGAMVLRRTIRRVLLILCDEQWEVAKSPRTKE